MTSQPPTPPDLMEQAHLALLRGHLGQARSLLERLVVAEPDNEAAQDLRATVIARQAAIAETNLLQSMDYAGGVPSPGSLLNQAMPAGSVWTRPVPSSVSALLDTPSAWRWPAPLRLAVRLAPFVLALLVVTFRYWPSPQDARDAQVARSLVESAYRSSHDGTTSDLPRQYLWERIERDYGPAMAWRIRGSRREFLTHRWNHYWTFDVDVTRTRAVTREQVEASAGRSSVYGYSSSINDVRVESVRPLPPR